jgi:CheY-like chemotaxis protein
MGLVENSEFVLGELIQGAGADMVVRGVSQPASLTCLIDPSLPERLVGDALRLRTMLSRILTSATELTHTNRFQISVFPAREAQFDMDITLEVRASEDTYPAPAADALARGKQALRDLRPLLESLGGEAGMHVERSSEPVFWCRVPVQRPVRTSGPAATAAPASSRQPRTSGEMLQGEMRILMAEDNTINQRVGKLILQRAGYHIDLVADGNEALEAHRAMPYDLILMDCQMPTMDGFEATRRIRSAGSHQPVIIAVTANALVGERERCLDAGMDDYLSKPFQADQLIAIVEKWADAAKLRNA